MSNIKTFDKEGKSTGSIEIADALLVLDKGDQAVKDVVVAILNARRAGTASTLGKGEVSGSNKKPWKQKGTGRARAGFRQSPIWRGGGSAHGPHPKDFGVKVNKKVAQLAYAHALSEQIAADRLAVVDALPEDGKTKAMAAFLGSICAKGRVLVVTEEFSDNTYLAIRNIPKVEAIPASQVDVYSLLLAKTIVVTKEGLEVLKKRMGAEG